MLILKGKFSGLQRKGRMVNIPMFLLTLAVFWSVLYLVGRIFHLEKYGLEVGPAYFVYKSKRLAKALDSLSRRRSNLWRTLCNIGIVLAAGLMVYAIYILVNNILTSATPQGIATRMFLVIPGITIRLYWLPYFLVAGMIIVVTHEVAHGIAARLEKVPIVSAGVALALVFPGAFVEPDEKKFEKAPAVSKLRIVAVGSATNLVTGLLVFLLWSALFTPAGIVILETTKGGPIEQAGLGRWDIISAINGTQILNGSALEDYMDNVTVGDTLILHTNKGDIPITTVNGSEGRAVIGLTYFWNYFGCKPLGPVLSVQLYTTLSWMLLLAVSIAIFNMLPLYPFDGDKFFYYALGKVVKRGLREIRILTSVICLGLMATTLLLSFIRYGLIAI